MGRTLIKIDENEDRYVLWSSFTDAPIGVGTAKEWKKYFIKQAKKEAKRNFKTMLDDTDKYGSSAGNVSLGYGQWDDEAVRYQGSYTFQGKLYFAEVTRKNLRGFIEKLIELNWDYDSEELAPFLELELLDD